MALRIAQLGQPILRRAAQPVLPEAITDTEFQHFLAEMAETLVECDGMGLAAPQVFVSLRVFIACVEESEEGRLAEPVVFINPVIVSVSVEKEAAWEGCLSFSELSVLVPRHRAIKVEFLDRHGESKSLTLQGRFARVFQHEYDHLDGILTLDRAVSTHDIIKASELEARRKNSAPESP